MNETVAFGEWTFHPDTGELTGRATQLRLEPTVARLLAYFLAHQGRLVSRDELIENVWSNRIVSDDPINRCISILRQALTPDDRQAFIKTVPRKGYIAAFPEQPHHTASIASQQLKRVPVWLYLVVVGLFALLAMQWRGAETISGKIPNVAVMPFEDLSAHGELSYLADGISDTVIHLISKVDNVDVMARTSSFAFRNTNLTAVKIGQELNVDHLLEGSVQQQNNRVKVLTRLIDTKTDTEVWSDEFVRPVTDVFSIQDDIAHAVVKALKGTVTESGKSYQPDLKTYEIVILGKKALGQLTEEGLGQAEEMFRQAIEREPDYPLPYVLLARTLKRYMEMNTYTQIYPRDAREALLQETEALVEKALSLDPMSSEAHNLMAHMKLREGDITGAETELRKAIDLEPNNADAIGDLADILQKQGQVDSAVLYARRAVSLNPKASRLQQILAQSLWMSGRAEEAIYIIEQDAEAHPDVANNYVLLGRWSLQLGQPGNALLYAYKERALDPDNASRRWYVCLMYFQLWQYDLAHQCGEALLARFPDYYEARVWLVSNEYDKYLEINQQQIDKYPQAIYYRLQGARVMNKAGLHQRALDTLRPVYPQLFEPNPQVTDWTLWAVRELGFAWMGVGETEKATTLLKNGLQHTDTSRKLLAGGFSSGIDDVYYLMLLGDYDEALKRLQEAVDANWAMYSMGLDTDPIFKPVFDDPRFQHIVRQQAQFLASEYAWATLQIEKNGIDASF